MKNRVIEYLSNRKLLILGFGKEGYSTLNFLHNNGIDCEVDIADINSVDPPHWFKGSKIFSKDYQTVIPDYDLVIKSPGVRLENRFKHCRNISSQIDIFLRFFKEQVIGVTGTKGKSTVASMIHHLLKDCGKDSILGGNIGVPVFDIIDDIKSSTHIVLELSSHQLQFVNFSPSTSILLNIFPEHLDYYENFDEYSNAKKNIFKFQNSENTLYINSSIKAKTKSRVIPFSSIFDSSDKEKYPTNLLGDHNKQNGMIAVKVASDIGIKKSKLIKSLESFIPLKHRLEYFGTYRNIKFIDDSISTIPESTIEGVKSLKGEVDTIILGGKNRSDNIKFNNLVQFLERSNISNIILIPETGLTIKKLFSMESSKNIFLEETLEKSVERSFKVTQKDKYVLLSPAASSYNMFKNFEERGELFKEFVKNYSERT
ncbi:MAG: UDP-N-acetylmuramoyl-L-alanine--D-glutamate ligase [Candidatus Cloacimonadota bacterium]|nr:MAG: UDP-N-acetylmuramoyl-L-alanine--D-glutamate ligase [Candidatus Cloacimonadota bacterium]PIE78329.1 MAG: UDP-N-acetylmuramoyl-L-alanine--D-glutamate ligase [Candidatus Delongbacteria bacterium]